jgi:hypothetical protein
MTREIALAVEEFPDQVTFALRGDKTSVDIFVEPSFGDPYLLRSGISDCRPGDGYRWYYCFSFSFAAILGWSPITRELLGLKRRSDRRVEKGEDGARAQMIEEFIISCAILDLRKAQRSGATCRVSDRLVEDARRITCRYDLPRRAAADWRRAFDQGCEAWLALHSAGSGLVRLDVAARQVAVWMDEAEGVSVLGGAPSQDGSADDPPLAPMRCVLWETKRDVVEMFLPLAGGGLVNVGSKAEEWSHDRSELFRWHDVFHLANLAKLGWSPVMRSLLSGDAGTVSLRSQILEEAIIARAYADFTDGNYLLPAADFGEELILEYTDLRISAGDLRNSMNIAWDLCSQLSRAGGGVLEIDTGARSIRVVNS